MPICAAVLAVLFSVYSVLLPLAALAADTSAEVSVTEDAEPVIETESSSSDESSNPPESEPSQESNDQSEEKSSDNDSQPEEESPSQEENTGGSNTKEESTTKDEPSAVSEGDEELTTMDVGKGLENYISNIELEKDSSGNKVTVEYDSVTDTFTYKVKMALTVSMMKSEVLAESTLQDGYYTLSTHNFPAELSVPATTLKDFYNNGSLAGRYQFTKTADGSVNFTLEYLQSFVDQFKDADHIQIIITSEAAIGEGALQDDGKVKVKIGPFELEITPDQIPYPDNVNPDYALIAEKSGGYNFREDTLDYSVVFTSPRGTPGVVTIEDVVDLGSAWSKTISLADTPLYVKLTDENGNTTALTAGDGKTLNSYSYTNSANTISGTTYNNTKGTLKATLPQLKAGGTYTLTYSYQLKNFPELTSNTSNTIENDITATSTDGSHTVTDKSVVTTTPNNRMVTKGTISTDKEGVIKWEIHFNQDALNNIAGGIVYDDMFKDALTNVDSDYNSTNDGIRVQNKTDDYWYGFYNPGVEYDYVKDSDGNIIGLKFKGEDVPNEGQGEEKGTKLTTNNDHYVIVFYTKKPAKASTVVTNTVKATFDGKYTFTASASYSGAPGKDYMNKTANTSNVTYDDDGNAQVEWTVKVGFPKTYAAGTFLTDMANNGSVSGTSANPNITDVSYFTKAQIEDIYTNLGASSTYTLFQYTDQDNFYVLVNAEDMTGTYTIKATQTPSTGGTYHFVKYKELLNGTIQLASGKTADNIKYHGFGMVTTSDIEADYYTATYRDTVDMTGATATQKAGNVFYVWGSGICGNSTVDAPIQSPLPGISKGVFTGIYADARRDARNKNDFTDKDGAEINIVSGKDTNHIQWSVVIYPYGYEHTTITLVDTLPKGVKLNYVYLREGKIDVDANGKLYRVFDNNFIVSGTVVANTDGTQTLTMTFKKKNPNGDPGYFNLALGSTVGHFALMFDCSITEDAENYPKEGEKKTMQFYNEAKVYYDDKTNRYASDSNTVRVTYDRTAELLPTMEKSGTWDNESRSLSYSVDINSNSEDLVKGTSKMEVIDELSYIKDDSRYQVNLDMNSVKLYYAKKEMGSDGLPVLVKDEERGEVDEFSWNWKAEEVTSVDEDGKTWTTSRLILEVPDSQAVILEYKYVMKFSDSMLKEQPQNMPTLKNSAHIYGTEYGEEVNSDDEKWQYTKTDAKVTVTASYNFYKVDENNYKNTLSNALFELFEYENGTWVDTGLDFVSDKNGAFTIAGSSFTETTADRNEDINNLKRDAAYYLVETEAPMGYTLPDNPTKYYFCHDETSDSYPAGWGEAGGEYANVVYINEDSKTEYVTNSRDTTDLTVTKQWQYQDGTTAESHPDELEVYLKRCEVSEEAVQSYMSKNNTTYQVAVNALKDTSTAKTISTVVLNDTFTDTETGIWTNTWENLPALEAVGEGDNPKIVYYYYFAEEAPVEDWDSSVNVISGTSADGDSCTTYQFINQQDAFELPETGGSGTGWFRLVGMLLVGAAAMLYIYCEKWYSKNP
jgi:LPXTG-motif cell wall-anchored protein